MYHAAFNANIVDVQLNQIEAYFISLGDAKLDRMLDFSSLLSSLLMKCLGKEAGFLCP